MHLISPFRLQTAVVSNSFVVIFKGTKEFKSPIVLNLSLPTKLPSALPLFSLAIKKLTSLKMYELNAGNSSQLQLKNTQKNFVFESLWHVIFGKALVCIKASNF